MNIAISISAGIAVPRVSAKTFVRMSRAEQEKYLEAYPQSSHQYLNSQPPGVINLADRLDTDPREVATYLREPTTNRLLGACGKGFGTLFNTIDQVLKMPNRGLMKGFEKLHETKAFQALQKGTVKVDKFLEKNPVLKKAGGPLVAGALAYQWLNMSFSGDFDDDFNIEDLTNALQGEYSIEQLLGTPAGIKGCAQLITGLATGGLLSFPWHSKMNIAFAAAYTGARKLGKSKAAQKMFSKWKANPDRGRKTLEAKAGNEMKIELTGSKTVKIRMTPRKQSGVVPYKMTKMLEPKFLLVRKTGSGKWGFPKGKVETGMTPKKSALVEAWEEAGIKGKVVGNVGRYSYIKNKTRRVQNVDLFLMLVNKQKNNYLEVDRERKWFTYSQALKALQKTQMPFLRIARQMIEEQTGI